LWGRRHRRRHQLELREDPHRPRRPGSEALPAGNQTPGQRSHAGHRRGAVAVMPDFDFAILGAGAMGSIVGGHLARAGHSGVMLPDGAVLFTRNVNIMVGELSGGDSPRAQRLARTLDDSGVRATATSEILTLEWSKFCAWAGFMALSVTTRAVTWKYLLDPDCALVLSRLVREMGVLAHALGIGLSDRSILPVASICAGTETQAVAAIM